MTISKFEELSTIARNAAAKAGKVWEVEEDKDGFTIHGEIENPDLFDVSSRHSRLPETVSIDVCRAKRDRDDDFNYDEVDPIAEHIINFSPKTALDLLKRLETAEAKLSKIEKIANKSFAKSLNPDNPLKDNTELLKTSEKILETLGALPHSHKLLSVRKAI